MNIANKINYYVYKIFHNSAHPLPWGHAQKYNYQTLPEGHRQNEISLNIGSGKKTSPQTINLDISPKFCPDIVADLNHSLPFSNNTFSSITGTHVLEHVDDLIFTLNELYRIAQPNAILNFEVPHQDSLMASADPTHKRHFNQHSIQYFCSNGEHYWIHESYGIKCDFILIEQTVYRHRRDGFVKMTLMANKK